MTKQNMHIHSKYSWDCEKFGKMEIEEIARILYENGIRYGAITDHIEFDREPLVYVLVKLRERNLEIDRVNELYEGKVTLLKAAEVSEPHLYKDQVETLNELSLDFLMGSIHKIDRHGKTEIGIKNAYSEYYEKVLKTIETNRIDVIGHLDYINKYYDIDHSSFSQINEVLEAIKESDKIIEINTSGLRRNTYSTFPSLEKICKYMLLGKKEIVIGTDAHKYSELTDNLEQADLIQSELGLKPVIYQKRKRIII